MQKTLSILLLSTAPVFALAAGESTTTAPAKMESAQPDEHASAAGRGGDAAKVSRTINVTIDIARRFNPSQFSVKAGETIRLAVKNGSPMAHEVVIGTMDELKAHAKLMRSMPNMDHSDSNMMKLAPGQSSAVVWQFGKAGVVSFACLVPGHMETGMLGKIVVE